jgi:hypothetical protein
MNKRTRKLMMENLALAFSHGVLGPREGVLWHGFWDSGEERLGFWDHPLEQIRYSGPEHLDYIADGMNCSRRTVRRLKQRLIAKGCLIETPAYDANGRQLMSNFHVLIPPPAEWEAIAGRPIYWDDLNNIMSDDFRPRSVRTPAEEYECFLSKFRALFNIN